MSGAKKDLVKEVAQKTIVKQSKGPRPATPFKRINSTQFRDYAIKSN
jgi:hypothetical protein